MCARAVLGAMALFPGTTGHVAHALGFSSLANVFFCTAIAALAILHLRAMSRLQLRSITLIQELAIVQGEARAHGRRAATP